MTDSRYWAVVPAAGVGRRMGANVPKQYLPLGGRPILERTLTTLKSHRAIAGVMLALSAADEFVNEVDTVGIMRCEGGQQRCESVLNALEALSNSAAGEDDWVLVHDAVRPLLRSIDIDHLLETVGDDPNGGVLGLSVRDTMKRTAADGGILETVSREHLWHALTPQMFPLQALRRAIEHSLARQIVVTDEAQAMELQGARPQMVEGHADNIKITHPFDLPLAERLLKAQ